MVTINTITIAIMAIINTIIITATTIITIAITNTTATVGLADIMALAAIMDPVVTTVDKVLTDLMD
jgi:hypothetical protein